MSIQRTDVCIAGGGIIGLAVAFELAQRGQRVTVIEAAGTGERAAAGVAAGMIAPVSEVDVSHPDLTRLALVSHDAYPAWVERIESASSVSTGFDQSGTLWVAAHRDHPGWLEHLRAFQVDRGLDTVRLTAAEVRDLEPWLAPNVSGGLLARDDWQVDPRRLLQALMAAIAHHGGSVIEQTTVDGIEQSGDGWIVAVERVGEAPDRIEARNVVITPGAYGARLLDRWLGDPGLRPVKGQILRLRSAPGEEPIARRVIRTPDVYLVPRADGEVVVGATMEEMGFDDRVTALAVHDLLREARRVVPGILELELAEVRAGFRPALRDHLPAIGAVADGLFVAAGHYRNGVGLAPTTARLLADLLCDGHADPLLAPYDPLRFAHASVHEEATR